MTRAASAGRQTTGAQICSQRSYERQTTVSPLYREHTEQDNKPTKCKHFRGPSLCNVFCIPRPELELNGLAQQAP
jgi:hypothetical protein